MSFTSAPELLSDLKDKCQEKLQSDIGLDSDTAEKSASVMIKVMQNDWRGQQIYIPKCAEETLSARDRELWSKFNGSNHKQLAKEFDVSVQWVYKITSYMRAHELSEKQIDAFPDEDLQNNPSRRHA